MDGTLDVLLKDGLIVSVGDAISASEDARTIDCTGLLVTPGLIDVHVHLREPGGEHKETIATGARSAAAGGFTAVCAMPNTDPPLDDPASVGWVLAEGKRAGAARVYPTGCISVDRAGERLAPVGEMIDAGAVAITDDGSPIMKSGLMRLALEYAQSFGIPVADHPEDLSLSPAGQMNEGLMSTRMGLVGKPNASEDIHIIRDLLLAELTGGHIHLQHVSTRWGVDAIRQAKARGVHVTAEASPHHLVLTDEAVEGYRTEAKMNPPLRTAEDVEAVRAGLADGSLDHIATDHAPHHYDEKEAPFAEAPNGIVGLETAVGIILTRVVDEGVIDLPTMIERMSCHPAKTFNLPGGTLAPGGVADVSVLDLSAEWTVDASSFVSKSRNTPFDGWALKGGPAYTIVGGRIVWER
ncbi:MAG: dihydroorotase [Gemmatimonadales bacterium]|jgi:dihydroorotase|nr:dihydroorotase [Gemmatimonadales bacterium]MBT3775314.1 dihydroorotase [Gemmatimonadales bacterium]MBT3957396.1 dihydroorotase [Gemmatimonadales bacterium]MBT4436527.1 dihydroorotase [Gemmatimonadales bacterium]MBT5045261.1 dihydroorotase [Gemmatimonadales bacterium]